MVSRNSLFWCLVLSFFFVRSFVHPSPLRYPEDLLNATVVQGLSDVGVNVIRLGFMWSGAQPTPGAFNETYVDIMAQIVDLLGLFDIFTLLDVHQVRRGDKARATSGEEMTTGRKVAWGRAGTFTQTR
jgi:hypothetical protein